MDLKISAAIFFGCENIAALILGEHPGCRSMQWKPKATGSALQERGEPVAFGVGRRPQTPGACPIRSCSSGTLGIFGCRITVYRFMRKHERVNRYTVIFENMLTFNPFYGIVVVRPNMLVWARVNS